MDINKPLVKPLMTKDQYEKKIDEYKGLLRDRDRQINEYEIAVRERDRRQMRMEIEARRRIDIQEDSNRPSIIHVFAFLGLLLSIHYAHIEIQKFWISYTKEQEKLAQAAEKNPKVYSQHTIDLTGLKELDNLVEPKGKLNE